MALDIDTDAFRRSGHHVADAGSMLQFTPGADVPACGADQISQTLMDNLNARQSWLNAHLQAGAAQAFNAAEGMDGTASAYQQQDQAAAATYGGGYVPAAAPAAPSMSLPAAPAPSAPPILSPIPTISDQDGEQIGHRPRRGRRYRSGPAGCQPLGHDRDSGAGGQRCPADRSDAAVGVR